jgi:hypothetical protein
MFSRDDGDWREIRPGVWVVPDAPSWAHGPALDEAGGYRPTRPPGPEPALPAPTPRPRRKGPDAGPTWFDIIPEDSPHDAP